MKLTVQAQIVEGFEPADSDRLGIGMGRSPKLALEFGAMVVDEIVNMQRHHVLVDVILGVRMGAILGRTRPRPDPALGRTCCP